MDYMILDSAGNALASFQDEETAHATLYAMSQVEPLAAEDVALIAYGDDGLPVGEAMFIADAAASGHLRGFGLRASRRAHVHWGKAALARGVRRQLELDTCPGSAARIALAFKRLTKDER